MRRLLGLLAGLLVGLLVGLLLVAGCHRPAAPATATAPAVSAPALPPVVRQIKTAPEFPAPTAAAAYSVDDGAIAIDGRRIPIAGDGPVDSIAHGLARVPRELRDVLQTLAISPTPSPNDAYFAAKYKLPVKAGMATGSHGDITIFPYGLELMHRSESILVKNFMHELGHAWSRIEWQADPKAREAWLAAIASDPGVASEYARTSFKSSGAPDEDVAETTALFFLVRGTPRFEPYRAAMPARFALIAKRFEPGR
ncbi:MAG TPA: hypothetical protein VGG74_17995 [Kofleriaceae bacterium]